MDFKKLLSIICMVLVGLILFSACGKEPEPKQNQVVPFSHGPAGDPVISEPTTSLPEQNRM